MIGERRDKERVLNLEVYTDGSLKRMGQIMTFGGWAFIVVRDGKKIYWNSDSVHNTTNQRMELEAVRQALQYVSTIRRPCERVIIYSDSAYIINCYNQEWYIDWQSNHWYNSNHQPVANSDLWAEIIPYFDNFWYSFEKVPAHSNVYWNEECDGLAQYAANQIKHEWRGKNG